MLLLGDRLSPTMLAGILLVSVGILSIAAGRALPRSGLLAAAMAGVLTTAYTIVDAHAVRLAPDPMTFIAWFFVFDGLWMFPMFLLRRRCATLRLLRAEGRKGVLAGITTVVCFGAALLALRFAPVGIVSALRETSVIFAMALAGLGLRERIDRNMSPVLPPSRSALFWSCHSSEPSSPAALSSIDQRCSSPAGVAIGRPCASRDG